MSHGINQFAKVCRAINFGAITLLEQEKILAADLHMVVMDVIKSLPVSVQTDALLTLTRHLKIPVEVEFNFFQGFYPPVWSILGWLLNSSSGPDTLSAAEKKSFNTVHATVMLLHLIDDHLTDKELPATHLNLLIRSQLWVAMNRALGDIVHADAAGSMIAQGFINEYYASIGTSDGIESLDAYSALFSQQMAMGFIAPVLLTRRLTGDERQVAVVRSCLGAFGRAWRLLDDLHDIRDDMETGTKSSVYFCLPEAFQKCWQAHRRTPPEKQDNNILRLIGIIREHKVVDRIIVRICRELEAAASMADTLQIDHYAQVLRNMAKPLIHNGAQDAFGC